MKTLAKALSLSAVVSLGALATSQAFAHGPSGVFHHFDQDGDGKVTRSEARAAVQRHFSRLDQNEDRAVSLEELRQQAPAKRRAHGSPERWVDAHFRAHDKNENGKLERSEVRMPDEIFDRIDKNGDGAVTRHEALEAARKRHEEMRRHRGRTHDRRPEREKAHFDRIDTSGDGLIDESEAKNAADRVFSRFDENGDDVVTSDEVSSKTRRHGPDRRGKGNAKKRK